MAIYITSKSCKNYVTSNKDFLHRKSITVSHFEVNVCCNYIHIRYCTMMSYLQHELNMYRLEAKKRNLRN